MLSETQTTTRARSAQYSRARKKQFPISSFALFTIIPVLLSGCASTTVTGIKPLYPKVGILVSKVDSLQPEFKWEGGEGSKAYDMAIWDTVLVDKYPQPREIIYKQSALNGCAHRIDIALKPDTFYYWSVRNTGSDKWSTVTHTLWAVKGESAPPTVSPDAWKNGRAGTPTVSDQMNSINGSIKTVDVQDTGMFLFFTPKAKALDKKKPTE